jgi:hypothetical protein
MIFIAAYTTKVPFGGSKGSTPCPGILPIQTVESNLTEKLHECYNERAENSSRWEGRCIFEL